MIRHFRAGEMFAEKDFPLVISGGPMSFEDFPLHTHEFTELVLITGGHGTHLAGAERWEIGPGDVFVLSGALGHGFQDLRAVELWNCMFEPKAILGGVAGLSRLPGYHALFRLEPRYRRAHRFESRLHLSASDTALATRLVHAVATEIRLRRAGWEALAQAKFVELVVFLCQRYGRSAGTSSQALYRIGSALSLLESRWREPLRLADLARAAHLSANQFLRVFREATGTSPIDYRIRLAIHRAADLLRETDLAVTTCAHASGFADSNYFAKQFRRVMGTSPRAWRRIGAPGSEPVAKRRET